MGDLLFVAEKKERLLTGYSIVLWECFSNIQLGSRSWWLFLTAKFIGPVDVVVTHLVCQIKL